jgi:hypothetical protein
MRRRDRGGLIDARARKNGMEDILDVSDLLSAADRKVVGFSCYPRRIPRGAHETAQVQRASRQCGGNVAARYSRADEVIE